MRTSVLPTLHVYGVGATRLAGASVMPMTPHWDCHTVVLMITEKAADLIKETHGFQNRA